MSIEQIDPLIRAERLGEALRVAEDSLTGDPRVTLRRARLLGARRHDEALLVLLPLLEHTDGLPEAERVMAFTLAAQLYASKRCRSLAYARLAKAKEACGDHALVALAEGRVALVFDDREAARAAFERAAAAQPGDETGLGLADIAYVEGDFAATHRHLDAIGDGDHTTRGLRLRASTCAAQSDFAGEAAAWQRVLERVPDGDRRLTDWLNHGFALAAAGERAAAIARLTELWRLDPEGDIGRYARSRTEHLERAAADAPRKVLVFPTTQQKYCYCGPAVIELCLRSLGIELSQDEIAKQVKRDTGTPMFEIVRFLDACGIAARRIVASEDKIRAAIDLGLPVIVQEEYSTTSHVAVMTGYDQSLGVFVVHDPMSHRTSTRPFGWTERAGELFGNGGVLVLGRKGAAREAEADAAGLVDTEYMRVVDDCSRQRASARADGVEGASPEEVLAATSRALELQPTYRLAWYMRLQARVDIARRDASQDTRDRVLEDLYHVRTAFPSDEWPCQLHARWLLDERQYAEAFAAYHDAHRRDRSDGNNIAWLGTCKWYTGKLVDAERYLLASLEHDADPGMREGCLAGVYLRELETRDSGERELPHVAINLPREVHQRITRPDDELVRRALHFAELACELLPAHAWSREARGLLLARAERWADAERELRRARELAPTRWYARAALAIALEAQGHLDEAKALLVEATEKLPQDPDGWLMLGSYLARRGEHQAAADTFATGIARANGNRDKLVEPLWEALSELGSTEEAAARLREHVQPKAEDTDLLWAAANLLDENHQRGHAIALLRQVVAASPRNVAAIGKLGTMLSEDWLTRTEGRAMLERAITAAPGWAHVRRQLALHHVASEPARGVELIKPVLGEDDPWTHEVHAMLLDALGQRDEAERITRRVIAAWDGPPDRAVRMICNWHRDANRYDRALHWARRTFDFPVPPDKLEYAQHAWLATFRLAGKVREILPKLKELCAGGVPEHLAWETYWAVKTIDRALAAEAAKVEAADNANPLIWRIHEAEARAHLGELAMLDALPAQLGSDASAWANLAWAYGSLDRWDEATAAATKAHELDANDDDAITATLEARLRAGDVAGAIALAERLLELHPYAHTGPERLAQIHAKSLAVELALRHGAHAVDAAPYCHIAQESHALALFAAGRHDEALLRARRALDLSEPDEDDEDNDALMIVRALSGDRAGVERCLANLAKSHPRDLFPEFQKLLLETAEKRASKA